MGSIQTRFVRTVPGVIGRDGKAGKAGKAGAAGAAGAQGEPGVGGGESTYLELEDGTNIPLDCDYNSNFQVNTQSEGTLTFVNPIGTPTVLRKLLVRLTLTEDQEIAYGTQYRDSQDLFLPIFLRGGFTHYLGFIWNELDSKWDILSYNRSFG